MIKRSLNLLGLGLLTACLTACGSPTLINGGFTPLVVVITPSPRVNPTSNPTSPSPAQSLTNISSVNTPQTVSPTPKKVTPVLSINPDGTYTVKSGDTLLGISIRLGVDLNDIISLNNIDSPDNLQIGQVLKVPPRKNPTATKAP